MDDNLRPSPGLNMEHGFMRKIEQNQHIREQQCKEDVSKRLEVAKMARKVGMPMKTAKPTMEIYRPPSLRGSNEPNQPTRSFATSPTLVAEAPPFIPAATCSLPIIQTNEENAGVMNSTSVQFNNNSTSNNPNNNNNNNNVSPQIRTPNCAHISKVHFQLQQPPNTNTVSIGGKSSSSSFALKRSRSLGAGDLKSSIPSEYDIGGFGLEVQSVIRKALDDPNKLSPRQLMELVRHIFNRVVENTRFAEPAARLFFAIIEKEKTETFLESTLNSCREFYNERSHLLRNFSSMSGDGSPNHRWVAYVSFMYELYARLKTRQRSPSLAGTSAVTAGPMLLSLLGECCHVFLRPPSLFNFTEIECLFFILTSIGRDLESEMPQRMKLLMGAVRDAFTTPSIAPFISKSLLQLIELQASNWQLTTPAVTYYYPGSQERK